MIIEHFTQHLSSINLTDHQKMVLAKAVNAGAIDEPSRVVLGDEKLITARDVLDELDLIDYSHESDLIQITPEGIAIMKQSNIIDDSDQLSQSGQQFADGKIPNEEMAEQYTFKRYLQAL